MATPRDKFQKLLRKLFQFDCADLDFGIYRIMNYKRCVIERFIDKDLLDGVAKELASGALARESGLSKELAEVAEQVRELMGDEALDAEGQLAEAYHTTPLGKRYLELRARAVQARSSPELEAEIFNHLYAFFSRYYDEGDFMSLRRYSKRDRYAIPYNGEEVHLHWANSDQYYIKTGENFTDYRYKHGAWTVEFKLRQADVEQNNNKGAKRFFLPLVKKITLDRAAKKLMIPFDYRPLSQAEETRFGKGNGENNNDAGPAAKGKPKAKRGQDAILADAVPAILAAAKEDNDALVALTHEKRKDADGDPVTLLEHHVRTYTRKNQTDYFIHKDLQGFLERELDFYLKNEVLNLDDLGAAGEFRADGWFQLLRVIKSMGRKIIAFVAQIENFQKRVWLKKKFVTETNYCLTLDRVPKELYPEIATNHAQREEWVRLFAINGITKDLHSAGYSEPLKPDFLKANPNLLLDTRFFSKRFLDGLLHSMAAVDADSCGLMADSENHSALSLFRAILHGKVQCVYADPPYNTDGSPILYKNGFKNSTWISLIIDRLALCRDLLTDKGVLCATIDDCEQKELHYVIGRLFGEDNIAGTVVIRSNPSGRPIPSGFGIAHEYAIFATRSPTATVRKMPRTEAQRERYDEVDEKGRFMWELFRKRGSGSERSDRPTMYYPLYAKGEGVRVPKIQWDEDKREWIPEEKPGRGEKALYPVDAEGVQRRWRWSHEAVTDDLSQFRVRQNKDGETIVYYKYRPDEEGVIPTTVWTDAKYSATEHGTGVLKKLFSEFKIFDFPKSVFAVEDCLHIAGLENESICVDCFAGSGTTGHAIVNLNRRDGGQRRFVLIEMGAHFEAVLKPRIQKVLYSDSWQDGKPLARKPLGSYCFKYLRLESYEDALDNITFTPVGDQAEMQFEDSEYVLSYMLDFETRESETLLNVAKLDSPFDYKLRRHGREEPLPVDLPETFNYLIGLHVRTRRVHMNGEVRYLIYRGLADGRETAVIWRTTRGWEQKEFEADREFVAQEKLAEGAEDIYVNTDSFIEGARSLDPVFKRLMFTEE